MQIDHSDSQIDEKSTIREIRLGNIEVFEKVFKQYFPRLKNYGIRLTGNPEQAEDLVQEAFATLWEKRYLLNDEGNLTSFLFKSVRNKILNHLEHQKVVDKYIKANHPDNQEQNLYMLNFLTDYEYKDLHQQMMQEIDKILATLPENCRKTFYMSRIEGMKNKEIAEELGLNIKTVEKHLSRTTKTLKSKLKKTRYIYFLLFLVSSV
ncbi:MAG: RNA polymerase sigma-70 factor [Bacteroidota bacterium]